MTIPAFVDWDFNNKIACLNKLVTQINTVASMSMAQFGGHGESKAFLSSLNSIITQVNTAKGKSIPLVTNFDESDWLTQVNKYIAALHTSGTPF